MEFRLHRTSGLFPVDIRVCQPAHHLLCSVDGNCLVVTARSANPEAYDAATLAPASTFELPSSARVISVQPGRLVILTGHSVEVWSTTAAPPRKRRST